MSKNKITIEWRFVVKDFIKNLWVILLVAIIGYMSMFILSHKVYTPKYTSSVTLVVNSRGTAGSSLSNMTMTGEIANVLVNVFTQSTMKSKAAEYLGAGGFNGEVSAEVMSQTNFINLSVTADDPETAYELLCAIITVYPEISDNIFANAVVNVIGKPDMATAPSNKITQENRDLVILGCVSVVSALIFVLSITRDTIKSEEDYNEKIDTKLLGSIIHQKKGATGKGIKKKKEKGLLIHNNAFLSLLFTESFHKIAAKLEYINHQSSAKVFAVTSVAENEGKSTCAANIAVSLADRGNRVLLIDLDGKKPALYKIFSEAYEENSEFSNLLTHKIRNKDFRLKKYKKSSLFLALNTRSVPQYYKWLENGEIKSFIETIKTSVDYIIIDTAPIVHDASVADIMSLVDKTLLVIRTDKVRTPALIDAISTVEKNSNNLAGCILNDVYPKMLPFAFSGNDDGGYRYGKKYSEYGYGGYKIK